MRENTLRRPKAPPELDGNPASNRPQFDRYGGFVDIQGQRTGFFHTERIRDRWWLVTPDGHGFFGMGLSHPITSMSEGAITFACDGNQEEWMRNGIRKMRALGFNCVWSGPYSLERIPSGNIGHRSGRQDLPRSRDFLRDPCSVD